MFTTDPTLNLVNRAFDLIIISLFFDDSGIGRGAEFTYSIPITICWRTVMTVRKTTFQRLVHLPMSAVLAEGTADHLARVVRDCSRIARGLKALGVKNTHTIWMGWTRRPILAGGDDTERVLRR